MSWVLDTPVLARGAVFAAIAEVETSARRVGPVILATASKSPRVMLMHDGTQVAGIDRDGRGFTEAEIETRFPGAVAALKNIPLAEKNQKEDQGMRPG